VHLPDAIERIRPSIIQVLASIEKPAPEQHVVGTAFLIHLDGFALTARHVVASAREVIDTYGGAIQVGLALPEIQGPVDIRASFEIVSAVVVEEDDRHDLALLRLERNPFESGRPSGVHPLPQGRMGVNALYGLAPLTLDPVRDGQAVAVSGYPSPSPTLITTHGVVASATSVDVAEIQPPGAPEGFVIRDVKDSYLIDVAVNPGNSGGPVYSVYEGAVIGTCVAFQVARAVPPAGSPFAYNSGLAVAIPMKYGVELLGRHVSLGGT
jgi:S1-C subfamily serine protease